MRQSFKKGDLVWYRQRDGTFTEGQVDSVDLSVQPASYGVKIGHNFRETESPRLKPRTPGQAGPFARTESSKPPAPLNQLSESVSAAPPALPKNGSLWVGPPGPKPQGAPLQGVPASTPGAVSAADPFPGDDFGDFSSAEEDGFGSFSAATGPPAGSLVSLHATSQNGGREGSTQLGRHDLGGSVAASSPSCQQKQHWGPEISPTSSSFLGQPAQQRQPQASTVLSPGLKYDSFSADPVNGFWSQLPTSSQPGAQPVAQPLVVVLPNSHCVIASTAGAPDDADEDEFGSFSEAPGFPAQLPEENSGAAGIGARLAVPDAPYASSVREERPRNGPIPLSIFGDEDSGSEDGKPSLELAPTWGSYPFSLSPLQPTQIPTQLPTQLHRQPAGPLVAGDAAGSSAINNVAALQPRSQPAQAAVPAAIPAHELARFSPESAANSVAAQRYPAELQPGFAEAMQGGPLGIGGQAVVGARPGFKVPLEGGPLGKFLSPLAFHPDLVALRADLAEALAPGDSPVGNSDSDFGDFEGANGTPTAAQPSGLRSTHADFKPSPPSTTAQDPQLSASALPAGPSVPDQLSRNRRAPLESASANGNLAFLAQPTSASLLGPLAAQAAPADHAGQSAPDLPLSAAWSEGAIAETLGSSSDAYGTGSEGGQRVEQLGQSGPNPGALGQDPKIAVVFGTGSGALDAAMFSEPEELGIGLSTPAALEEEAQAVFTSQEEAQALEEEAQAVSSSAALEEEEQAAIQLGKLSLIGNGALDLALFSEEGFLAEEGGSWPGELGWQAGNDDVQPASQPLQAQIEQPAANGFSSLTETMVFENGHSGLGAMPPLLGEGHLQVSYLDAWTWLVQACAVELERGGEVLRMVSAAGLTEAFCNSHQGSTFLQGLGQLYLASQILEAAMQLHAESREPLEFRGGLDRCKHAWAGAQPERCPSLQEAVLQQLLPSATHLPVEDALQLPSHAASAFSARHRPDSYGLAHEEDHGPQWQPGLCGLCLLPLEQLEQLSTAPWAAERRPCLVILANLWTHRVHAAVPTFGPFPQ